MNHLICQEPIHLRSLGWKGMRIAPRRLHGLLLWMDRWTGEVSGQTSCTQLRWVGRWAELVRRLEHDWLVSAGGGSMAGCCSTDGLKAAEERNWAA